MIKLILILIFFVSLVSIESACPLLCSSCKNNSNCCSTRASSDENCTMCGYDSNCVRCKKGLTLYPKFNHEWNKYDMVCLPTCDMKCLKREKCVVVDNEKLCIHKQVNHYCSYCEACNSKGYCTRCKDGFRLIKNKHCVRVFGM